MLLGTQNKLCLFHVLVSNLFIASQDKISFFLFCFLLPLYLSSKNEMCVRFGRREVGIIEKRTQV